MVDSIAGKPLVIGNSVLTLNPDKKTVHVKSPDGEKDLNGEQLRKYLLANVPKVDTGDTVSFKGEEGGGGGETSGSVAKKHAIPSVVGPTLLGTLLAGGVGDIAGHFGISRLVLGDKLKRAEAAFEKTQKGSAEKVIEKLKSTRSKIAIACGAGLAALYVVGKLLTEHKKENE